MPEVKSKFRVKVTTKLKERDPDTGEVLREFKIEPNMIDDKKMIAKFMQQRGRGKKNGLNQ